MGNEQTDGAVWSDHLDQILRRVWDCLGTGPAPQSIAQGIAEGRRASLATIGKNGGPEQRSVMLRAVDEARGLIDIHTDSETAKVAQIRANPMVSIMVWRADMEMQIRLTGRAQILLGAAAASLWRDVPLGARPNYGVTPAPGSKIPAPGAFSREADSARFAVLRVSIEAIDAVILAQPQHRRAVFERADDWGGAWLAP